MFGAGSVGTFILYQGESKLSVLHITIVVSLCWKMLKQ